VVIDAERLAAWVDGYVAAWSSNDQGDIAALFAEDATYRTEPHADPWRGRAEIVRQWLARRDAPGETTFRWQLVASDGDLAVVQGETTYPDRAYSNLWLVRLDGRGACTEFTEWWMQHPRPGRRSGGA
jgi:ketosteroid isomerase-like protein